MMRFISPFVSRRSPFFHTCIKEISQDDRLGTFPSTRTDQESSVEHRRAIIARPRTKGSFDLGYSLRSIMLHRES